jgi:hypothetical protein
MDIEHPVSWDLEKPPGQNFSVTDHDTRIHRSDIREVAGKIQQSAFGRDGLSGYSPRFKHGKPLPQCKLLYRRGLHLQSSPLRGIGLSHDGYDLEPPIRHHTLEARQRERRCTEKQDTQS